MYLHDSQLTIYMKFETAAPDRKHNCAINFMTVLTMFDACLWQLCLSGVFPFFTNKNPLTNHRFM